jgi:hypothetical protein
MPLEPDMNTTGIDTPLPTLDWSIEDKRFDWPAPPFARRHMMAPLPDGATPCRIETLSGESVEGEVLAFDADATCVQVRIGTEGRALALPFSRFRRLTLLTPWSLAQQAPNAPVERLPTAAHERDYWIELPDGNHLAGRTMGHVKSEPGLFLFAPNKDGSAVLRVFVPQTDCVSAVFGKSVEESVAERWIATPEALLAAVDAQQRSRILSVGDALVELGLVTHGVIELMLQQQGPQRDVPLGEMLIAAGYLAREDLQTALAHKMGYPMVDLQRFPIERAAMKKLSHQAMVDHRVLPLMQRGDRLFVAVDDLARIPRLNGLKALAGVQLVAVIAPRSRLKRELDALSQSLGSDVWANNVPVHQQSVAA